MFIRLLELINLATKTSADDRLTPDGSGITVVVVFQDKTFRFINPISNAIPTNALTTAIMEPTIDARPHRCAEEPALRHTKVFVYECDSALELL